jgi:hypothetical protein
MGKSLDEGGSDWLGIIFDKVFVLLKNCSAQLSSASMLVRPRGALLAHLRSPVEGFGMESNALGTPSWTRRSSERASTRRDRASRAFINSINYPECKRTQFLQSYQGISDAVEARLGVV